MGTEYFISQETCEKQQFPTFFVRFFSISAIVWMEIATIIVFVLWKLFRKIYQSRSTQTASTNHLNEGNADSDTPPIETPQQSSRLNSLDTFRGLAIVTMIFANSGCGKYHWLEHVPWNGIHPADFIFPSFLWIMGVCIPISVRSQLRRAVPTRRILLNILIVCVPAKGLSLTFS